MRAILVSLLVAGAAIGMQLAPGAGAARAETLVLQPVEVTGWKAVFGRVEARDRLPARARLGGTLMELSVKEGDQVRAGDVLGRIVDEKLIFQLSAIDANRESLMAQLTNAETELKRGEDLLSRGVTTVQRLDALRTQVDVIKGQIAAVEAERAVVEQQAAEGAVLAPADGRVLDVPVAMGAVVMPGEVVATLGGGGIFLRLAVPERHAAALAEGDSIRIEGASGETEGRLERIYPADRERPRRRRCLGPGAVGCLRRCPRAGAPAGRPAHGAGGAGNRADHPRGAGFRRRRGRGRPPPARRGDR
jgi:biotin carboxyl carrier protein